MFRVSIHSHSQQMNYICLCRSLSIISIKMFYFLAMILCSIATLLILLDFLVKNYTTYKIAKSIQGPTMYPIIGAIDLLFSKQSKYTFKTNRKIIRKFTLATRFSQIIWNGNEFLQAIQKWFCLLVVWIFYLYHLLSWFVWGEKFNLSIFASK